MKNKKLLAVKRVTINKKATALSFFPKPILLWALIIGLIPGMNYNVIQKTIAI
jgi:hypothetical protein